MCKLVYGDLFRARDLFHWEHFGLRVIHSTPGTKSVIVLNSAVAQDSDKDTLDGLVAVVLRSWYPPASTLSATAPHT